VIGALPSFDPGTSDRRITRGGSRPSNELFRYKTGIRGQMGQKNRILWHNSVPECVSRIGEQF
jgi:hypothetical protein